MLSGNTASDPEARWLLQEKHGGRMTPAARRDLARLRRGEHVNYLIGWAPFLDCRIDLSAQPLIPRPETEYWTEKAIGIVRRGGAHRGRRSIRVLDLFCGSGCIGIAVLKHVPQARVDFADIEKKYFAGIRKSLRANRIGAGRTRCFQSDVFKGFGRRRGAENYDYILANPPYIAAASWAVAKSVLRQEPRRALFAGRDGLRYIRKVVQEAKDHLMPGGIVIMEFDPPQKPRIAALARQTGWTARFYKDQYGRWRFVHLKRAD